MTPIENQPITASLPRKRRRILILCAGILLIFLLSSGIMLSAALKPLSMEAGDPAPTAADFARIPFLPIRADDDLSAEAYRACGTHTIHFTVLGIPLHTTLTVADTRPPVFTLQEAALLGSDMLAPEAFITQVWDASAYTVSSSLSGAAPKAGTHEVVLTFTDAHGNTAQGTTLLHVYGKTNRFTAQAGISVAELKKLIRAEIPAAEFPGEFGGIDLSVLGEQTAVIRIDEHSFPVQIHVQDTVAPEAEMREVHTLFKVLPDAKEFLASVTDATAVTASYIHEPDVSVVGWQNVSIRLTDAAGNTTDVHSELRTYSIPSSIAFEAGIEQYEAISLLFEDEVECSLAERYNFPRMAEGDYTITVNTPGGSFNVAVTIRDTTPPTAEPRLVTIYLPSTTIPTPADFVDFIEDSSEVTTAFVDEVDFATPGRHTVPIRLTDAAGNSSVVDAYLDIVDDHTAPVITGVRNLSTYVNGRLSYKTGVTATDGDGACTLTVDSSDVNLAVPGRYRITYTATDDAGNTSTAMAYVTVLEITEDVIRPYAENILDKILESGMTAREKARAIYDWMTTNVAYVTYADKTYWMRAAYHGFTNGRGDCYVYYAMSRILLDCAGIDNLEICRDDPKNPHFWNLVNCGDGWYHFDTCPHYKQYPLTSFMLTDAEVEAYSKNKVKDYYSFDKSLYPATP